MDANQLAEAAFNFILKFSPLVLIIAAVSVADLIVTFVIKLMKQAPTYGFMKRRSGR